MKKNNTTPVMSIKDIVAIKTYTPKSYSHKPHLAELPHDRRTNDPELLQERIDAIDEALKDVEDEIDFAQRLINGTGNAIESNKEFLKNSMDVGDDAIQNMKKNDFSIYDYGELPEDANEPYGIIKDYERYQENLPLVEEYHNKIKPQINAMLKDPTLNINSKDLEQYKKTTEALENGTARMMRIYSYGDEGDAKVMELYNDSHALKWRADLMESSINVYKSDIDELKEQERELKTLQSKKQDYLDERERTETKKDTVTDN